jgi:hypothetical protein
VKLSLISSWREHFVYLSSSAGERLRVSGEGHWFDPSLRDECFMLPEAESYKAPSSLGINRLESCLGVRGRV